MTKRELSQLRHLKFEARELIDRIKELESTATSVSLRTNCLPRVQTVSDKVGGYAAKIVDLKKELDKKLSQIYREYVRLNRHIANIEDSQMRAILALRYIKCFPHWYNKRLVAEFLQHIDALLVLELYSFFCSKLATIF